MLSLSAMAQASNYSAEKQVVDGVDVVRLDDRAHHIEVSICTSVGNIAFDLRGPKTFSWRTPLKGQ